MGTINCGCDDEFERKKYLQNYNSKTINKHYNNIAIMTKPYNNKKTDDSSDDEAQNKLEKAERIPIMPESPRKRPTSIKDFDLKSVLGRGSFGKVLLVEHLKTGKLFAMKVIKKKNVMKRNQRLHTKAERIILEEMNNHPFIVQLHYAFQTEKNLYIVMDFMQGGELFFHLKRSFKFTESRAKLYIAEIILALEALHKHNIVYRDLKPENILLGDDGHIKVCDFGLSKQKSPEMKPYFSEEASSLLKGLLCLDPKKRLGAGPDDANEIKAHPFFSNIDFDKVYKKQCEPLFKPKVTNAIDLRFFDKIFIEESINNLSRLNSNNEINPTDKPESSNTFSDFSFYEITPRKKMEIEELNNT